MDLLGRVVVTAVSIVVIMGLVYYALKGTSFQHVTKQQAESLIISDLQQAYPGAVVNVTNDTPSNYSGSYHITTSLVLNATSPCPAFYVYTFDYPQFGFVYRIQNTYTANCIIYGITPGQPFTVSSYPVAITRSYTLGLPSVKTYINQTGRSTLTVTANYYNSTSLQGVNYTKIWLVAYRSRYSTHSVYVVLSQQNASLIRTYNAS